MRLNRRQFIAASSVMVAAASARAASGKKYKACIIGDTALGGYGHSIQYAFALRDDVATVALADPDEAGRATVATSSRNANAYWMEWP